MMRGGITAFTAALAWLLVGQIEVQPAWAGSRAVGNTLTEPSDSPPSDDGGASPHAMPPIPSIGSEIIGSPGAGAGSAKPAGTPAEAGPPPVVEYDFGELPAPVRALREKLIAAAKTGDPAQLAPIIEGNGSLPDFGDNAADDDPIEFLKSASGDAEGREILAILLEVLEAGFVHVDVGTPDEMYIWPYFARYPTDQLTPPQIVELFKLIYAGDWEDMKNEGRYLFYRVGIDPSGKWRFFTAGD